MVSRYTLLLVCCELVAAWCDQYKIRTESEDVEFKNAMYDELSSLEHPSDYFECASLNVALTVSVATVLLIPLTRRFMMMLDERYKDTPKIEKYRLFMMIWLAGIIVLGLLNMTILHYFLPEAQTPVYHAYFTSSLSVFWTYSCQQFFHSASIDYRFPFRVDWEQLYKNIITLYIVLKVTLSTTEYIFLPEVYFCLFCVPCIFDFYFVYIGWIKVNEQALGNNQ